MNFGDGILRALEIFAFFVFCSFIVTIFAIIDIYEQYYNNTCSFFNAIKTILNGLLLIGNGAFVYYWFNKDYENRTEIFAILLEISYAGLFLMIIYDLYRRGCGFGRLFKAFIFGFLIIFLFEIYFERVF